MEGISKRIFDFFYKHKGYKNDTVVAKQLGYSHPEKISRLFREGKAAKPSVDILEDIANKFGEEINIEWLVTGKGLMLKQEKSGSNQEPDHHLLTLLNKEVESIELSLDRIRKAASMTPGLSKPEGLRKRGDLSLDKKSRSVKSKEPKDTVSKKGT